EEPGNPAARRDRARDLQPARPASALEQGAGGAREARHQDRVAVGRGVEEVRRGGARGEPAAHEGANGKVGRREGLRPGGPSLQPGVKTLARAYDAVIFGMAALAAFLMAAMMVVICVDVLLRNLGYQSSAHFFTFTEYALLMVPCMGAPWLV